MYIGHKSTDGRIQLLKEHITGVSEKAKRFADPFGGEEHAGRTALLHDAGKYSAAGQRRMSDPEHTAKVDHATAGAKIAWEKCRDAYGASAIIGHHGGMPDLGSKSSVDGDGTVMGRCKKELAGIYDPSDFWIENRIDEQNLFPLWLQKDRNPFLDSFYTRMLFSCLVDADYLDTEAFMQQNHCIRGQYDTLNALLLKLDRHIVPWLEHPQNELNAKRSEILQTCIDAAKQEPGLFTLTVPTGGGKTISSLAFALTHAVQYKKERIIYVIPYTSIIEQNAEVFREILGDENIIEHHSGVETDETNDLEGNDSVRRKMLATENWDAPLIVTTAVQFFESLFSNKPSKCRKLHNIANSVIVFDEAQMLPLSYLKPCVWAMAELVRHYRVTAVLCTATQPSLNDMVSAYWPGIRIREIIRDVPDLQAFFRRVHFCDAGQLTLDQAADAIKEQSQVLCIVNTRKNVRQLFKKLPPEGSYHLSTWMPPEHRSAVLKEIKERLRNGFPCRVVSTSLLEAGVDVDFPQVWREKAGLDSILQAAGRCNREGKRTAEESKVVLFSLEGTVPKNIQPNRAAADTVMDEDLPLDESPVIQAYFNQLYRLRGEQALDAKGILDMCAKFEFQSIAKAFHFIEDNTFTVYIPKYAKAEDIAALQNGEYSRALMRRLGRSAVSVYQWDWNKLVETGAVQPIDQCSGILRNDNAYDPQCGLVFDEENGMA